MDFDTSYWNDGCDIIPYERDMAFAINKKRGTIVYLGEWNFEKNVPHGNGKQYKSIGKCERDDGRVINDTYYPFGKILHKGYWNNGVLQGYGHHWFPNGTMYKGGWDNNKMNGYGIYYNSNKKIEQKGTWKDGNIFNGYGRKVFKNKSYFIGDIHNGEITQNGKLFNKYGDQLSVI